jgi:hypothetical protein
MSIFGVLNAEWRGEPKGSRRQGVAGSRQPADGTEGEQGNRSEGTRRPGGELRNGGFSRASQEAPDAWRRVPARPRLGV